MKPTAEKKSNYHFKHIPALDGLRGFSILALSLGHFMIAQNWLGEPLFQILGGGWIFVDCFFVLSGFLVTSILLETRERPGYFKKFYFRRQLRIFPLYFFAIVSVFLVAVIIEGRKIDFFSYDSLLWYLLYLPNLAMTLKGGWLDNSQLLGINHLWAVGVEEQFYLFWPLVVYFTPRKILLFIATALLVLGTPIRYLTGHLAGDLWGLAAYLSPWSRMDALAAGALVALLLRLNWEALSAGGKKWGKILYRICVFSALTFFGLLIWKIAVPFDPAWGMAAKIELWFWALYLGGFLYMGHWIRKNRERENFLPALLREACKVVFGIMLLRMVFDLGYGAGHEKFTHAIFCFSSLIYLLATAEPMSRLNRFFENKFLMHIGFFSYGIYLFHHMLRPIWERTFEKWFFIDAALHPLAAQTFYILAVSLCTYLLARLSWIVIERPFIRLKK